MQMTPDKWVQVKDLFQAALTLGKDARRAFLAQQCPDAELRGFVEQLLLAQDEAGNFLVRDPIVESEVRFPQLPEAFQDGDLLAERFGILRLIARGGMGDVYEAEDMELGERVAIKTIRPEILDQPGALQRFKREVLLAKQVTHPNVCRIFDLFRHPGESGTSTAVAFVSMELLNGETLAEHLKQQSRMSLAEALPIIEQVGSGVGAAHAVGILHRDLKPGNIMLVHGRHAEVRAVVTDFGIALRTEYDSSQVLVSTGPTAFGTPAYMSPEQLEGEELTAASDLYSLGLVIYQMVTGVQAFEGKTPLSAAVKRLTESPIPPSERIPGLGQHWDAAILRCLERRPQDRFGSIQDLLAALREGLHSFSKHRWRQNADVAWGVGQGLRHWLIAVLLVALAALALGFRFRREEPKPAEQDMIVLADFVNTTGEPAFDNSMRVALEAKLQQSPFLNLMPTTRVHEALRYMGRPVESRITADVARQVCVRENGRAFLLGSVTMDNGGYRVGLKAFRCNTGELIASQEDAVGSRGSLLEALDQAADVVRRSLGESLDSIRKFDVPLHDASTTSLEALAAYSHGNRVWNEKGGPAALSYFQRAVDVDPNFAMAFARLGTIYGNVGEYARATDALQKAFDRRDRVTEWERFYITSHYYAFVTGELDKEIQTYEQWKQVYPRDMAWPINLGEDYAESGQYEKAVELEWEAIRGTPGLSPAYADLAQYYLALDRPDEARSVLNQARAIHVDDLNLRLDAYQLSFYANDTAGMQQQLVAATAQLGIEDALLSAKSDTEFYYGRLRNAKEFAAKACDSAGRGGSNETQATWQVKAAVWEAEFGARASAVADVNRALRMAQGKDVQVLAALALASAGETARAQVLVAKLGKSYPLDTLTNAYWLPIIRARGALGEGKATAAIKMLEGTSAYELGSFPPLQCMYSAFLRGEAYLAARRGAEGAAEFRKVLSHRGIVTNCPVGALSQLGLARALALMHDAHGSQVAYQDFFALWQNADPSLVVLRRADAEFNKFR